MNMLAAESERGFASDIARAQKLGSVLGKAIKGDKEAQLMLIRDPISFRTRSLDPRAAFLSALKWPWRVKARVLCVNLVLDEIKRELEEAAKRHVRVVHPRNLDQLLYMLILGRMLRTARRAAPEKVLMVQGSLYRRILETRSTTISALRPLDPDAFPVVFSALRFVFEVENEFKRARSGLRERAKCLKKEDVKRVHCSIRYREMVRIMIEDAGRQDELLPDIPDLASLSWPDEPIPTPHIGMLREEHAE